MGTFNDDYINAVQKVAFDIKRMYDNEQTTKDMFEIDNVRIIDLDLIEWNEDISNKIVELLTKQHIDLINLKLMFEAERVAIEKKHGTIEFDRENHIIFGVKFYSDNTDTQESRKFTHCIDMAIDIVSYLPRIKTENNEKEEHKYDALLSNKYDAGKVYEYFFKGEIALCTEDCFNDWFVNKKVSDKITPTLKGRKGKIAVAKIRCFIETITGNTETLKDGYYKNVFNLELNNTKTSKNLSVEHETKLKLCE